MGYNIELLDSSFFIAAEDKPAALKAMFKMWEPDREATMSGGSFGPGREEKWYSWMNLSADEFRSKTIPTLEQAFEEWSYPVDTDDAGNIIDIWFDGDKIGDEDHMFATIAPWVKAGSYLDFRGEDGDIWRWEFNGKTYIWKTGRISFE